MKIKEEITRDCCDTDKDLIPIYNINNEMTDFFFCKYCGRQFLYHVDSKWYKLPGPWEKK